MEAKWYYIFMTMVMVSLFGASAYEDYTHDQVKIECLKTHTVEECKKL